MRTTKLQFTFITFLEEKKNQASLILTAATANKWSFLLSIQSLQRNMFSTTHVQNCTIYLVHSMYLKLVDIFRPLEFEIHPVIFTSYFQKCFNSRKESLTFVQNESPA